MSTGESILLIYKFFLEQLKHIYNVLDNFEFLPGISYLDFLIGVSIIFMLLKLITFGIEKTSIYNPVDDTYETTTRFNTTIKRNNMVVNSSKPKKVRKYYK